MLWVRIVFFVVFLAVLFGVHAYLFRRMVLDVTERKWLRNTAKVIFGLLAVGGVAGRFFAHKVGDEVPRFSLVGLMMWVGLAIYLFMAVAGIDLARWIIRRRSVRAAAASSQVMAPEPIERRQLIAQGAALASLAVAGGVSGLGVWRAFAPPRITEVPVRIPGLPAALSGFTIAHLSDIHVGPVIQTRFLDELVRVANATRPDLVAITGDLVDGKVEDLGRHVAALQRLQSRHGTFFVTGNHDYYSGADEWAAALNGFGWKVLRNRHFTLGETGGAQLDLVGVDDWGHRGAKGDYDLEGAVRGRNRDRAAVLLSHQPQNFAAAAEAGMGLQLSGHTHGGQMFPATLFGQAIWGEQNAGLSKYGEMNIYVSTGCGFVGPPMRVGAPPEVVKLILLPA
jgi:predicted MPP superfamily phosphohydrolase